MRISQKPCNISQARLRAARERLSSNCILLKSVSDPARIVQRKENAPEFDYSSFYAKTGARDPPLFGGSPAFLMTRLRTAAHVETERLTVLYFPFRVRTPYTSVDVLVDEYLSGIELVTHHLFRRIYRLLGRGADLWPARYEANKQQIGLDVSASGESCDRRFAPWLKGLETAKVLARKAKRVEKMLFVDSGEKPL